MKSTAFPARASLCLLLTAAAAGPLQAAQAPRPAQAEPEVPAAGREEGNVRISFKIKSQGLESAGSFVVLDGSQSNYVRGGEIPVEASTGRGKGVEYRKLNTIVNCLPVSDPNRPGRVRVECQFEISGPLAPAAGLDARPMATFQLQTSFTAHKGRPLVLVDEPERRVEILIEDLD